MKKLIRVDASALTQPRIFGTRIEARLGSCNVSAEYRTERIAMYVLNRIVSAIIMNEHPTWGSPFIWHVHKILIGEIGTT